MPSIVKNQLCIGDSLDITLYLYTSNKNDPRLNRCNSVCMEPR